jgi:hypothetical protein
LSDFFDQENSLDLLSGVRVKSEMFRIQTPIGTERQYFGETSLGYDLDFSFLANVCNLELPTSRPFPLEEYHWKKLNAKLSRSHHFVKRVQVDVSQIESNVGGVPKI